jgi:hypothetical protein
MIRYNLTIFTHPDHPSGTHLKLWEGTVWKHYRSKVGEGCVGDFGKGFVIQFESSICLP